MPFTFFAPRTRFDKSSLLASLILGCLGWVSDLQATTFQWREPHIAASPDQPFELVLGAEQKVQDLDVSPLGPEAAILVRLADGSQAVWLWNLRSAAAETAWKVPAGLRVQSLAWHPAQRTVFLLGTRGKLSVILRVDKKANLWLDTLIHTDTQPLRRLVANPRPFLPTDSDGDSIAPVYRIFFGRKDSAGDFSIQSVHENGASLYQVIGKEPGFPEAAKDEYSPSDLQAPYALPIGFHPAGHILWWEDAKSCFHRAEYGAKEWFSQAPLKQPGICGGTVTSTPNGLALLHWQSRVNGVGLVLGHDGTKQQIATDKQFLFTPSSVPDGRGLVGVVRKRQGMAIAYVPVDIPLADVVNAWMFIESRNDLDLLSTHGGLLRTTENQQLHVLYESESYACNGYSRNTPTRPYLVTTDAFWEVMAAAYEGLFMLTEKQVVIPAFWSFINEAAAHFRDHAPSSWARIFSTLQDFGAGRSDTSGEAQRIEASQGTVFSPLIGHEVDFGALMPRGHYASDSEFKKYFRAFTYLTKLALHPRGLPAKQSHHLDSLPPALRQKLSQKASAWINPYTRFIGPSRQPTFWNANTYRPPAYLKHKSPENQISLLFPLAWGIDNEILNSAVFHTDWPESDQIAGPHGPRLLPSALDIPFAFGNALAQSLLKEELARYPRLGPILKDVGGRSWQPRGKDSLNLYARWMQALISQWRPTKTPGQAKDWGVWDAKRLQTGLASWATLRHATLLVNATGAAECGEGGFEEILMRPPRGYVEPDPVTFRNLAGMFRIAADQLNEGYWTEPTQGNAQHPTELLRKGLQGRLKESSRMAEKFAEMAEKQMRGEALTDAEYAAILAVGQVVEHHFLVYKSLGNKDLGLVEPDPLPKIAEVFTSPVGTRYLHAAVGMPMEWNQIVPYFGRREVVKGAVYSFHELRNDSLMNDKTWRAIARKQDPLPWIKPYLAPKSLACPARSSF